MMEVHYVHFEEIDSTNTWAKTHFDELNPQMLTCITAGRQTAGHGRYGRAWASKKGNLHLTLAFSLPLNSPLLPHLAQILTFALWQCLEKEGLSPQIKWPNDLLIDGKKLSGVLVEAFPHEQATGLALGIGVNVNAPIEIEQETTSLFETTGKRWHLDELRDRIIERFQANFQLLQEEGFPPFKAAMERCLAYKGEKISCHLGEKTVEGILEGLSQEGALIVQSEDGTTHIFSSGEITHLRLGQ